MKQVLIDGLVLRRDSMHTEHACMDSRSTCTAKHIKKGLALFTITVFSIIIFGGCGALQQRNGELIINNKCLNPASRTFCSDKKLNEITFIPDGRNRYASSYFRLVDTSILRIKFRNNEISASGESIAIRYEGNLDDWYFATFPRSKTCAGLSISTTNNVFCINGLHDATRLYGPGMINDHASCEWKIVIENKNFDRPLVLTFNDFTACPSNIVKLTILQREDCDFIVQDNLYSWGTF